MKRIIVSLGAVAMALAMTSTAFAAQMADRGGSNSVSNKVSTSVSVSNEAYVTNFVDSTASTGGNYVGSSHGDVKNVTVTTGDATSSSKVDTAVNSTDLTVDAPSCLCGEGFSDPNQTADRGGKNKIKTSDTVTVANGNAAAVVNLVGAGSSTGDNKVKSSHGDVNTVDVMTGMGSAKTKVGVMANFSSVMVTR